MWWVHFVKKLYEIMTINQSLHTLSSATFCDWGYPFVDFLYAFLTEYDFKRHAPIKDLNPQPKYFSSIGILFITRGMQMENLPTSTPIFDGQTTQE